MSDFLVAAAPLLVLWTIPLAPLLYTGIVATFEAFSGTSQSRPDGRAMNAGTAVLRARAAVRQQAATPTGDQQAA